MIGFFRSASEKPTALSMARAGARLGPSVIAPLRGFNGFCDIYDPSFHDEYDPSVRIERANSARCTSARVHCRSWRGTAISA